MAKLAADNAVLPVSTKVSTPLPPVKVSLESNPALAMVTLFVPFPVLIILAPVPAVMTSFPAPPVIESAVVNPPASIAIPAVFNKTAKAALLSAFVANVTFALKDVKSSVWIFVTFVNIESVTAEFPMILSVLLPVPPLTISVLERFITS